MRKTYFLFLSISALLCQDLFGQSEYHDQCAFGLNEVISEKWIDEGLDSPNFLTMAADQVLPVVFHIVRDNAKGNVLDSDVMSSLTDLNDAFRNINYYNPATGVDTEIQFCLAKQDENGLATTGITRTQSVLTDLIAESQDADLKSLIHWDANCYINIYIVNEISSQSIGAGVRGYSNFPSAHGTATDGLVVEAAFIGNGPINTTVLIHEMGHFLGLFHTFRGGCTNNECLLDGDRICDTPPDNSTVPAICDDDVNSCTTDAQSGFSSDQNDPLQNHMDYGYEDCRNQFTQGQKERMQMAINNVRSSLLVCESCQDPCSDPFTVTIAFDSLYAGVNKPFELRAQASQGGINYEWLLDGMIVGNGAVLNYPFSQEGKYVFILRGFNTDQKCVSTDTVCVEVTCPITIDHNLKDTSCLEPGTVLMFSANATGIDQPLEWYINGQLVSQGNTYSWTNPGLGVYEIFVRGINTDCSSDSYIFFYYVGCRERCDNNIDDDGDGLIDGYDPDCCDTINQFFFDPCYDNCPFDITDAFTSIQLKWSGTDSGLEWHDANTPLIGDVDNDGEVEIVGLETDYYPHGQIASQNIIIVNGKTGAVEANYNTNEFGPYSRNISIADTDRDGYAEIYMNHPGLSRYDITPAGTLVNRWRVGGGGFQQPNLTDFDEDGLVEVYMNNGIFDAATGRALVGLNTGISNGRLDYPAGNSGSAAVDVLPTNFCPNCAGKELVLGNAVYSVNINRAGFSSIRKEVEASSGLDGYTSIADFDLDGDLDAIVLYTTPLPDFRSTRHVYVWDLQTPTLLTSEYTWENRFNRVAHAAVGDVTGDGKPEIAIADYSTIRCFGYESGTWRNYFVNPNGDNSGMSGCAMFDFDADGMMEVYHRDETKLEIIQGNSGAILFSTPCSSGTGYDIPTVADIDGDREAELVCSCNFDIHAYEPNPGTWALTRPVWNQLLYYTVNVNDDLTIPIQQQRHHIAGDYYEVNHYLAQYGTKEYQASDLEMTLLDQRCEPNTILSTVRVCNLGPATFNDVLSLTYYESDPRSTNAIERLQYDTLITVLRPDSCFIMTLEWPRFLPQTYVVINDDGSIGRPFNLSEDFPSTGIDECDFENNVLLLPGTPTVQGPVLGSDTTMCDYGIVELDAGMGYASYRWQDGSGEATYTAFGPGKYWVTVTDACGAEYTDTIQVFIDSMTVIDLGPDLNLCEGDTIDLMAGPWNSVSWSPNENLSCEDCPSVKVWPDTTTTYYVIAETENGCYGFDSIQIIVGNAYDESDSVDICRGDSINLGGIWFRGGDIYNVRKNGPSGCDSVWSTLVVEDTTYFDLGSGLTVCLGDSISFDLTQFDSVHVSDDQGLVICQNCAVQDIKPTSNTILTAEVFTSAGCAYLDSIEILVTDTIRVADTIDLCLGDSVFLVGQWIKQGGIYQEVLAAITGCDTLKTSVVEMDIPMLTTISDQAICQGDTIDLVITSNLTNISWSTQNGVSCLNCPVIKVHPLNTTTYVVSGTSSNGCFAVDSFTISVESIYQQQDTLNLCQGQDSVFIAGQWVFEQGNYQEVISNPNGCDTMIQYVVGYHPNNLFQIDDTIYIDEGSILTLELGGDLNQISELEWLTSLNLSCNDCPSPILTGTVNGDIIVWITNHNGCVYQLSLHVVIQEDAPTIFIPNVFSPNGDGLNERIEIFTNDENAIIDEVFIFDRWGEMVYLERNVKAIDWQGWDGRFGGELLDPGVFVIRINGRFSNGATFNQVTDLTLLY